MKKLTPDLFLICLATLLGVGFTSYFTHFFGAYQEDVEIHLSFWHLPQYTFFSLSRGFFAFCFSILFSVSWGYWAAKDKLAEKFLIPLVDILQSIPILGFLPGVVLILINIFQKSNIGLELAAILLMFTSQVWNMIFGVYHSFRTIPNEKIECATCYRFTNFQRFCWTELPSSAFSLIWNSIVSVAGGWFFLMITEAFQLGSRNFQLPGIGSYMSVAVNRGDTPSMIAAIIAMISMIVFIDQFAWRPLIAWSQKFRNEETSPNATSTSWFLNLLKHSFLIDKCGSICQKIKMALQNRNAKHPHPKNLHALAKILSRSLLLLLFGAFCLAIYNIAFLLKDVKYALWLHLGKLLLLSFTRVYACVIFSVLIMLPLGLLIGLSEKWTKALQPLIQITASFPASLLFPIVILILNACNIPLSIGSAVLMLLGTQWYVLFNVMAGAKAMPSDLKEVAKSFRFNRLQRFFWLYLPAVFPYLITGVLSAAGGAWNASIVSEYVNYQGRVFTTPGIGSSISLAAQNNDYPLLGASILVMMISIAFINYQVWLRLYHYSEKRFTLNV